MLFRDVVVWQILQTIFKDSISSALWSLKLTTNNSIILAVSIQPDKNIFKYLKSKRKEKTSLLDCFQIYCELRHLLSANPGHLKLCFNHFLLLKNPHILQTCMPSIFSDFCRIFWDCFKPWACTLYFILHSESWSFWVFISSRNFFLSCFFPRC